MKKVTRTNDGKNGGVLEGESHQGENGGMQTVVVNDGKKILVEGGEVIINKHAAKKHWKQLSKINQSAGGGVAIHEPKFTKGGNTELHFSDEKIQTLIFDKKIFSKQEAQKWCIDNSYENEIEEGLTVFRFKQESRNKFKKKSFKTIKITKGIKALVGQLASNQMLYGGKIGEDKYYYVDDSFYTWQYSPVALYALFKTGVKCELSSLISHSELFDKYDFLKRVKVKFFDGPENAAEVEIPEHLTSEKDYAKILIKITLNFSYYHGNKKEFKTIDSKEPDLAKESLLVHELQHILQAVHNRRCGTTRDKAHAEANARRAKIILKRKSQKGDRQVGAGEINELRIAEYLNSRTNGAKLLVEYDYYSDESEIQARKSVRDWLSKKGVTYIDPLTEMFGIDVDTFEMGGNINNEIGDRFYK